jgi:RNA polymerase sigma-70 factor (ECF subfamily)
MRPSITGLLNSARTGDVRALDQVTPCAYGELRRLATICIRRERDINTLQPTALVHEVYLQWARGRTPPWKCSSHFFASAVRSMRQVLIQRARARHAQKRGGEHGTVPMNSSCEPSPCCTDGETLALEAALDELGREDPRRRCVIELRYFGGYTVDEIAAGLDVSVSTVERELRAAYSKLRQYLS